MSNLFNKPQSFHPLPTTRAQVPFRTLAPVTLCSGAVDRNLGGTKIVLSASRVVLRDWGLGRPVSVEAGSAEGSGVSQQPV